MPGMRWKLSAASRPLNDLGTLARLLPALIAALALLAGLLACGPAAPATSSSAGRVTSLALTVAAVLTETQAARVTPASATVPPTGTPSPASELPPATATLEPTVDVATPTLSVTPCVDLSTFVSDVTVPDGSHFAPGTEFVKTWRLNNAGNCTWTTAYQIRHVEGAGMNSVPVNLSSDVPPGANVDISISLVAPASNGTHIGRFQLFNPQDAAFGTRPYVEVVVP